ncbi:MAG: TRAP transporter large permease subunit, partial [Anaerolineales bacterium]|nr:TRAP transporter large permease subunit [Anaerolineales bacterium]
VFMPIVEGLGFNSIWFGMIMLINLGIGNRTPPFGFLLFVLKAVLSNDTEMGEIYRAAMPYVLCDFLVMALILVFPALAIWLPEVIR